MVELQTRHVDAETRRLEDLSWREKVREEDLAWREKVRAEDLAERAAFTFKNRQCLARGLAFIASAQIANRGTSTKELSRMAQDFTQWIDGVDETTN